MLFPTVEFALLFAVVFALSWALRGTRTPRLLVLIAASYVFYGYWNPLFCLLLAGSSLGNWAIGLLIHKAPTPRVRKLLVALGVTANLVVLGFFKYYGFFLENLADLLTSLGLERDLPWMEIILPVGISFFTFQGISYIVDVARGEIRAAKNPLDILLYISFFPQLVAGPIVRASTFVPQIQKLPSGEAILAPMAVLLILGGLFKKMVIANWLGTEIVDPVFLAPIEVSPLERLIAVYAFAVQIYCDFSAYSDIAIGAAALLGFRFPGNFNQPYRAISMKDFWRRWHISLSSWLRDYLYKPLGGNRKGRTRTYINLALVMLLGGLWHGAAWAFVIWGAIHGIGLAVERAAGLGKGIDRAARGQSAGPLWRQLLGGLIVFHIVCLAWVFFRAGAEPNGMAVVGQFFTAPVAEAGLLALVKPYHVALLGLGLLLHLTPPSLPTRVEAGVSRMPPILVGALAGLAIIVISGLSSDGVPPFIYFAF